MRKLEQSLRIEQLETRILMTGTTTQTGVNLSAVYSVDGSGNNAANPTWGQSGADLYRGILAAAYGDGVSSMNGQNLPSGRVISNLLGTQTDDLFDQRNLSAFIYAWGQFIDHDLDLTPDGGTSVPISVPSNDPVFSRISSLPLPHSTQSLLGKWSNSAARVRNAFAIGSGYFCKPRSSTSSTARRIPGGGGYGFSFVFSLMNFPACGCSPGV
jgi:hypothetical protein